MISDLVWFFSAAESSMGICSSFEAIRMAIMSHGASKTSKGDSMSERRLDAATRYRRVLAQLHAMPPGSRNILYAAYQPRQWPPELADAFGDCIAVTPFTKTANAEFEKDARRGHDDDAFYPWLSGVVLRGEADRIERIKYEALNLLARAHREYERT